MSIDNPDKLILVGYGQLLEGYIVLEKAANMKQEII